MSKIGVDPHGGFDDDHVLEKSYSETARATMRRNLNLVHAIVVEAESEDEEGVHRAALPSAGDRCQAAISIVSSSSTGTTFGMTDVMQLDDDPNDGTLITELCAVYRVHRVTMSRRLAEARHLLMDRFRTALLARLGADGGVTQSLVDLVGGDLATSLRALLAS